MDLEPWAKEQGHAASPTWNVLLREQVSVHEICLKVVREAQMTGGGMGLQRLNEQVARTLHPARVCQLGSGWPEHREGILSPEDSFSWKPERGSP